MKTVRILINRKPKYLTGKEIIVNTNNTCEVDGKVFSFDKDSYPNYSRGGK
jgi:hypothetical protein